MSVPPPQRLFKHVSYMPQPSIARDRQMSMHDSSRLWLHIVASLSIATVYLRHRCVVDIFPGLALGWLSSRLAPIMLRSVTQRP